MSPYYYNNNNNIEANQTIVKIRVVRNSYLVSSDSIKDTLFVFFSSHLDSCHYLNFHECWVYNYQYHFCGGNIILCKCLVCLRRRNLNYFSSAYTAAVSAVDPDAGHGELVIKVPSELWKQGDGKTNTITVVLDNLYKIVTDAAIEMCFCVSRFESLKAVH